MTNRLHGLSGYINHRPYAGPAAAFALCVLTRIPFISEKLFNMDSVQFALGMRDFDVTLHQPQPPGYFLYVMLARLLDLFAGEPNLSMVTLSIVTAGLTASAVFVFADRLFDRRAAWFAAAAFIVSPSMWFHSEVALSYMPEALMSVLVAMACHTALRDRGRHILLAAVLLGLAGGIRQSCFVFLLPMFLYAAYRSGARKAVMSIAVLACVNLAWFIPMLHATGGPAEYSAYMDAHWSDSNWRGISLRLIGFNARYMSYFALAGLGFCIAVLMAAAAYRLKGDIAVFRERDDAYLFGLWICVPAAFHFFIFTHPAVPGHSLIYISPLLILSGGCASAVAGLLSKGDIHVFNRVFRSAAALTVLFGTYVFMFTDQPLSNRSIRMHDEMLESAVSAIRDNFSPEDTEIIGSARFIFNFRHAMYYLPDYIVHGEEFIRTPEGMRLFYGYRRATHREPCIVLRPGTRRVVDFLNHPPDVADSVGPYGHVIGGGAGMPVVYYDVPEGLGSFRRAHRLLCGYDGRQDG